MPNPLALTPIKTPQELADVGFRLADALEQRASHIYFKDDKNWRLVEAAEQLRAKAQEVANLHSDPAVRPRLEECPLWTHAVQFPPAAPDEVRLRHFEQLCALTVAFADATENWDVFWGTHHAQIVGLWSAPRLWAEEFQEQQQIAGAALARHRQEKRAQAQVSTSKPVHGAPCYAERRKNGLSCNRGDLIEIEKLPTSSASPYRIEVSIKRCSQCWQVYKEYFVVDEATQQARSQFLMPDETDAQHGFHFFSAEAEAARNRDFPALLNPGLNRVKSAPGSG